MKQENNNGGLLVIKASAGSGKTYTLTKLYIEQLLFYPDNAGKLVLRHRPNYHKHILAITFTNKATDDMKRRIVKELYTLSQNAQDSEYYDYFSSRCTPDALDGMQQAAQAALNSILFNYSEFTVSTIDSFFQSILRCFARELDRDYNYEIQIDADFAVTAAVHSFLQALGRDMARTGGKKNVTTVEAWVRDFIKNNVSQGDEWNVYANKSLISFAKRINDETFRSRMEEMRHYLQSTTDDGTTVTDLSRIQAFKQMIIKARNYYDDRYRNHFTGKMRELMTKHGIDDNNLNGNKPLKTFLLQDKMSTGDNRPTAAMRQISADNIHKQFKGGYVPSAEACADILQLVNDVISSCDRRQLLADMAKDIGLLGLLGVIDDKLEQYRRDSNTILIADTNELIGNIIGKSRLAGSKRIEGKQLKEVVPFIYERVGTKVNHYMIDEFQDTSLKQYENFMPLLYESLSHSRDNFNMIIGDAKQSIYRFRNADPSIFRDYINEDFGDSGLKNDTLPTNFRSTPTVVEFNNRIFKDIIELYAPEGAQGFAAQILRRTYMPRGLDSDYQQLKHIKTPEGYVRINATDGNGNAITGKEQVLDMLPEYLLRLHERYDWKHIGILVGTNSEGNEVVERLLSHNISALPEQVISITSDESMLLRNSVAVRRIISMLRFIDLVMYAGDSDDDDRNATTFYKCRLNDQRMYRALGKFISLMANCDSDTPAGDMLKQCLESERENNDATPAQMEKAYADELKKFLPDPRTEMLTLTSIIEHIVGYIMDEAMEKETTFIMALQDCVATFETQSAGGTVREFLRYWDQRKDKLTVASASTDDAIRIMTIHKSKGLEFECVVLPFVNWNISKASRQESLYWMPREEWESQPAAQAILTHVPGINYDRDCLPPLLPLTRATATCMKEHDGTFSHFLDEIDGNRLIDNINKTYVAFTRPREELHMFTIVDNPDAGAKSNGEAITDTHAGKLVAHLTGAVSTTGGQKQVVDIEFGTPRSTHKCLDDEAKRLKQLSENPQEPIVNETMPAYFVTGVSPAIQVKLPHDTTAQQDEGTRMHNLMSRIMYKSDADKAIQFGIRRGFFGDNAKWNEQRFRTMLDHLFANPTSAQWFAEENTVYNERNIISKGNVKKRPDRVVRLADGTMIVVDYKFGEERERYKKDISTYADELMLMNNSIVQAFLIYIKPDVPPHIIKVR